MKLLIVESPAKCKTIKGFLGPGYEVLASYGHIRELSQKKHFFGIDIEHGFAPAFDLVPGKSKYISALQAASKKATEVYLAADDDREGEAIAWHVAQVLGLNPETTPRIVFREITKKAVITALQKCGRIDMNMVYSQQSRQIVDKLVGYELSPLLWKHISHGLKLSAGRVQSVVTRLVIDRETEIEKFASKSFFRTEGSFHHPQSKFNYTGHLVTDLTTANDVQNILRDFRIGKFSIEKIIIKEAHKNPSAPFITSTLQQEASSRLGFSAKQTMNIAQKLYEKGKITYMRTDSTHISADFQDKIKKWILKHHGSEFLRIKQYTKKIKGGQDAHECIRPTDVAEISLSNECTPQENKLYRIIWQRCIASQMSPQIVEVTQVHTRCSTVSSNYFLSTFTKEIFPGFRKVYSYATDEEETLTTEKFPLKSGDFVFRGEIVSLEKFTEPKPRYNEATLIKMLESKGIGRPSTYATMVTKVQEKGYMLKTTIPSKDIPAQRISLPMEGSELVTTDVMWKTRSEHNKLVPTDIGKMITAFLLENFQQIMDYTFTSHMEEKLDKIAQGSLNWSDVVSEFYQGFHPQVLVLEDTKTTSPEKGKYSRLLGQDPNTGENIWVVVARYGPCLQVGDNPKEALYKSLSKGIPMEKIDLTQALQLLQYPKNLGNYNGTEVQIKDGPYGFYIQWKGTKVSLPSDEITLPDAISLLETHTKKPLKEFGDIVILEGKWGPYIKNGKKNIPLKGYSQAAIAALTLEEVQVLVHFFHKKV